MNVKGEDEAIRGDKQLRMHTKDDMQCDICGEDMERGKAECKNPYCYDLSGLNNVFLVGITVHRCQHCGTEIPEIPRVEELNQVIAEALANKPTLLTGPEIRFLRNRAGFSAKKFAALLNVTPEHLSRIENDDSQSIGGATDKLARVATMDGDRVHEFLLRLSEMNLKKDRKKPEGAQFGRNPPGKKQQWRKLEGNLAA